MGPPISFTAFHVLSRPSAYQSRSFFLTNPSLIFLHRIASYLYCSLNLVPTASPPPHALVHTRHMESNKDEAKRCLAIARKHYDAENYPSARKFCQKSIALYETPEAAKLLASINTAEAGPSTSKTSASTSATETHPSAGGARHRHTADGAPSRNASGNGSSVNNGTPGGMGGEKREYTEDQHAVVKRVRTCKVTEYYEILSVARGCEEVEIKKAYRKVQNYSVPGRVECMMIDQASSPCFSKYSSRWLCILTRTAHQVPMRPSRVCTDSVASFLGMQFSFVVPPHSVPSSGLQSLPNIIWHVHDICPEVH